MDCCSGIEGEEGARLYGTISPDFGGVYEGCVLVFRNELQDGLVWCNSSVGSWSSDYPQFVVCVVVHVGFSFGVGGKPGRR